MQPRAQIGGAAGATIRADPAGGSGEREQFGAVGSVPDLPAQRPQLIAQPIGGREIPGRPGLVARVAQRQRVLGHLGLRSACRRLRRPSTSSISPRSSLPTDPAGLRLA